MLKLPQALLDDQHRHIELQDLTIVESCFYEEKLEDAAFTTEHELIYVISGELIMESNGQQLEIRAGEAILAKKGTYFFFRKLAQAIGQNYESVLFFIRESFINDFIRQYALSSKTTKAVIAPVVKIPNHALLEGFIQSLYPYFDQNLVGKKELLRLKTFELLIQLLNINPDLFGYFFQLNQPTQQDLVQIMEQHYTKNLPLKEYALLSGRSLSTFKRDFKKVFAETPAKWLKKKRLQLAQKLLQTTTNRPKDIYLQVGFANYAHFSKAFKSEYGLSPNEFRLTRSAM
ncbi:MAG: AraC family transcriptional regulator [Bacteroidota bacterium]